MKLQLEFFQGDDVVQIAKDLIGTELVTHIEGFECRGIITETEAYNGRTDRACHAYGGKRTARREIMYNAGGVAYVYLCYGIHNLFNIVTNKSGMADAVLIRAIEAKYGLETMRRRRNNAPSSRLSAGPGTLSQALGINRSHNGIDISGNEIWIEKDDEQSNLQIQASPRIGIDYAGEDAKLPWRFTLSK